MKRTFVLIFVIIELLFTVNGYAQTEQVRKKQFNTKDGVAVQGYDVISYYTSTTPKKGNKQFSFTYKGITYYFESAATQSIFKANPEKWEPAYGGWCAYAMGNTGEKVEVNPETFKIINNRLYLFYNAYFSNTLPKWNKDETNLKLKADNNWTNFLTK